MFILNNILLLLCVRLLWFSKSTRWFGEVAKSNFHCSCVLQIDHVICQSAAANERASLSANQSSAFIVSAGTDGRICIWDTSKLMKGFCRSLFAESENGEIGPALDCTAEDKKMETCCRNVAGEQHGDSLQNIEAGDTLAETICRIVEGQPYTGASLHNIEGSVTQAETVSRNVAVQQPNIKVSVTQAARLSFVDKLQLTEASEKQAEIHNTSDTASSSELDNKASGTFDRKLEDPCCVITAHQSGINSLAIQQRLSGFLCSCIVQLKYLTTS